MGGYVDAHGGAETGDGCCVLVRYPKERERVLSRPWRMRIRFGLT